MDLMEVNPVAKDLFQEVAAYYYNNACPLYLQERLMMISCMYKDKPVDKAFQASIKEINTHLECGRFPGKDHYSYINTDEDDIPF